MKIYRWELVSDTGKSAKRLLVDKTRRTARRSGYNGSDAKHRICLVVKNLSLSFVKSVVTAVSVVRWTPLFR